MQKMHWYAWKSAVLGRFSVFLCNVICKNVLGIWHFKTLAAPKMLTLGIARTSSALLSLNRIFDHLTIEHLALLSLNHIFDRWPLDKMLTQIRLECWWLIWKQLSTTLNKRISLTGYKKEPSRTRRTTGNNKTRQWFSAPRYGAALNQDDCWWLHRAWKARAHCSRF